MGNSNEIELHLTYLDEVSTDEKLSFKLIISTESESDLILNVHESLEDSFRMKTIKDLNLCKTSPFYRNKRDSEVVQVKISKNTPYIVNIHADYRFNHNENLHVYDFGVLGEICKDVLNNSFILGFTFYEADSYGLTNFFTVKSDGVLSNKLEIN